LAAVRPDKSSSELALLAAVRLELVPSSLPRVKSRSSTVLPKEYCETPSSKEDVHHFNVVTNTKQPQTGRPPQTLPIDRGLPESIE
jgi:hypothetical protein